MDPSVTIDDPGAGFGEYLNEGPMIAAVYNGGPQVYYIDSATGTLRHNSRGSTGWSTSPITTDGPGCTFSGHTPHTLSSATSAAR